MKRHGILFVCATVICLPASVGAQEPSKDNKPHRVLTMSRDGSAETKPNWESEQLQKAKAAAASKETFALEAHNLDRPDWEAIQLEKAKQTPESDRERVLMEAKAAAAKPRTLASELKAKEAGKSRD
ncbi:hypothetical protein [Shewanella sp. NIFS-20-20]|uniref:hypothetical protein n=1 Tax=Shewanella sp. NIFS-20-20 TaxID=2853806 RepID=UPI001C43B4C6|nr:hypothetical protein [Shewanella sp. NIFS-20-20]MBV7316659.1 hypothetical protein [Shewanella sp. NIFS-20-20]